jgi:hypothetical protein
LEDVSGRDSCDYTVLNGLRELNEIYGCSVKDARVVFKVKEKNYRFVEIVPP